MHRTEVDVVLAACAIDELSRIDGQPSDAVMPDRLIGMSGHMSTMASAGTTRASCAIVSPLTMAPFRFGLLSRGLARKAERGCRAPTHSRLTNGSANSECLT